jgi:hypothetical protein
MLPHMAHDKPHFYMAESKLDSAPSLVLATSLATFLPSEFPAEGNNTPLDKPPLQVYSNPRVRHAEPHPYARLEHSLDLANTVHVLQTAACSLLKNTASGDSERHEFADVFVLHS